MVRLERPAARSSTAYGHDCDPTARTHDSNLERGIGRHDVKQRADAGAEPVLVPPHPHIVAVGAPRNVMSAYERRRACLYFRAALLGAAPVAGLAAFLGRVV